MRWPAPLFAVLFLAAPLARASDFQIVDPAYGLPSVRARGVKAFPLATDGNGNLYTVTGTSPADSFVKISGDGRPTVLIQHVGQVVGVMAGLQEGFGGRFFANAGADPSPTPHGLVALDPTSHVAEPFAIDPRGYADGGLAFDTRRQRMYEINDAFGDLVAIDAEGRREAISEHFASHCVGLSLATDGSLIAIERVRGRVLQFNPHDGSVRQVADLGADLPGWTFSKIAVDPTDNGNWFICRQRDEFALYHLLGTRLDRVATSDNLAGLTIGLEGGSRHQFCVYVSNPAHDEIFSLETPHEAVAVATLSNQSDDPAQSFEPNHTGAIAPGHLDAQLSATSQPTGAGPLEVAKQRVRRASAALDAARADAIARFHASPSYLSMKQDVDAKQAARGDARENGTPQQRLDTDSAYNVAKMALEKMEKSVLSGDQRMIAATAELDGALAAREALQGDFDRPIARRQAQEKLVRDQQRAAEEEAALPQITFAQLDTLGERFYNKRVKITHVVFGKADNSWVDDLPGITISSDGLQSLVNTTEAERWIGFFATDSHQIFFQRLFALKGTYGDMIASLKDGTQLTLVGRVIRLDTNDWYGLVCDKIILEDAGAAPSTPPRTEGVQ